MQLQWKPVLRDVIINTFINTLFLLFLMKFCYFRLPLADRHSQSVFQTLEGTHWGLPTVLTVGDKQQTHYRSWVTPGAQVATRLTADSLVQPESVSYVKKLFFRLSQDVYTGKV